MPRHNASEAEPSDSENGGGRGWETGRLGRRSGPDEGIELDDCGSLAERDESVSRLDTWHASGRANRATNALKL